MHEIWGPAWFATALCAIVVVTMLMGGWEPAAPAFFCDLPGVFCLRSSPRAEHTNQLGHATG